MKKNPLISIITINYNNSAGLEKTMDSVRNLKFKDFEYIIIDGGSNDESKSILNHYLEDTELKNKISFWCAERDGGIYNAMNKGISHATGILLNFMNSGDTFLPDALNNIHEYQELNENCVLYGAINKVKGNVFLGASGASQEEVNKGIMWHQASFIPKKLFLDYGLYDEKYKICADYEHFLRLVKNNVKFVYLNRIICNYDFSGLSSTNKKLTKKEGKIIKKIYFKEKKSTVIKNVLKVFVPYGILFLLWKAKENLKPFG